MVNRSLATHRVAAAHRIVATQRTGVTPVIALPAWLKTNHTPIGRNALNTAAVTWANANLVAAKDYLFVGDQGVAKFDHLISGPLHVDAWHGWTVNNPNAKPTPITAWAEDPLNPGGSGYAIISGTFVGSLNSEGSSTGVYSPSSEVVNPAAIMATATQAHTDMANLGMKMLWFPSCSQGSSPAKQGNWSGINPNTGNQLWQDIGLLGSDVKLGFQGQDYQSSDPVSTYQPVIEDIAAKVHGIGREFWLQISVEKQAHHSISEATACLASLRSPNVPDVLVVFGLSTSETDVETFTSQLIVART